MRQSTGYADSVRWTDAAAWCSAASVLGRAGREAVGGCHPRAGGGSAAARADRVRAGSARLVVSHLGDVAAGRQVGADAGVDAVAAVVVLGDERRVIVRAEEREEDVGRSARRHLEEPVG